MEENILNLLFLDITPDEIRSILSKILVLNGISPGKAYKISAEEFDQAWNKHEEWSCEDESRHVIVVELEKQGNFSSLNINDLQEIRLKAEKVHGIKVMYSPSTLREIQIDEKAISELKTESRGVVF